MSNSFALLCFHYHAHILRRPDKMWWLTVSVMLCLQPISAEANLAPMAAYASSTATDVLKSPRATIETASINTGDKRTQPEMAATLASFGKYIPLIIALSIWLLSISLFYEGVKYHQMPASFSILSGKVISATLGIFLYTGIITFFYALLLVRMTDGWPNINRPGGMIVSILLINPEIFVPILLILSLYPSISAMLRFANRGYVTKATLDHNGAVRSTFSAMAGFFLSLTIFILSISIFVVFVLLNGEKSWIVIGL